MRQQRRNALKFLAAFSASAALPSVARAAAYPSGPVNVIVPYGAGGSTDILARLLVDDVGARHGGKFFVENKPGAAGNIGTRQVAVAKADGGTLLYSTATPFAINPFVYKTLPFDPVNDFQPIVRICQLPLVLVVSARLNIKTVPQLIDYLRDESRKPSYSSYGVGVSSHLAGALFSQRVGAPNVLHVPYKDMQAMADLSEGRNVFHIDAWSAVSNLVEAGKLVPLAVSSTERLPWLPNLPTIAEAIGKDYELVTWHALFAPSKTPSEVIAQLHDEFSQSLAKPQIQAKLTELGFIGYPPLSPKEIPAFIAQDRERWKSYVALAGIQPG